MSDMRFTDEDLKLLKEELIGHDTRMVTPLAKDFPKALALLYRLACAEAVAEIANSKDAYTTSEWVQRFSPTIEAWLRSCGR